MADTEKKDKAELRKKALHYAVENLKNYPLVDKTEVTLQMALSFHDFLTLDTELSRKILSGNTSGLGSVASSLISDESNAQTKSISLLEDEILAEINNNSDGVNGRWLSIAKTDIQKGFMALRRALANKD